MDLEEELLKWETEFKRGFSKPFILLSLADKPNYPYQIIKSINRNTKGKISIAGSNIYPILRNLEDLGLITNEKDSNSLKRIYSLSEKGEQFLADLKFIMDNFMKIIQTMIDLKE